MTTFKLSNNKTRFSSNCLLPPVVNTPDNNIHVCFSHYHYLSYVNVNIRYTTKCQHRGGGPYQTYFKMNSRQPHKVSHLITTLLKGQ